MHKALIIDDEKHVRQAIELLGEWERFSLLKPYYASNGQDGLIAMKEISPEIVFVDMKMPVMDGKEFLRRATVEFSKTQYIVISGYDDFELVRAALKNNVIDYLLKPINEDDLNDAISKAVAKINKNVPTTTSEYWQSTEAGQSMSSKSIAKAIKQYIDENYSKEVNLSMFSDKYHFSKEYLTKIFKERYNCGIYEYALNLKMSRAKELLNNQDVPINEIALRLGYNNSNYFSKAFKNFHSISPSEYREKLH
ncbi:helix-turn-helix domain-containing protein [Clostridium sp. 19966]|uniref:response regulator transcription factor n=1 Tax=Clostridium sp. 19966 TaxID=2768166 RepID=UPI0028DE5F22|nr:helix-turn-helix domain-containing protein [Clostridium sp. 19966]MDT8716883.1 helix-turn-helix domain-containing protein [Clostridium sp. 19966]